MKTLIIIQARTGSTRLPGKVLKPLAGAPLLQRMLERVRAARTPFDLPVATTAHPSDDPIRNLCKDLSISCFSGDPFDLLDRHYQAAKDFEPDAVVKIPSDCPLIDPDIVDRVLAFYEENSPRYDYVSNLHPPSYPDGNAFEVM